jgi:hypothetical protein
MARIAVMTVLAGLLAGAAAPAPGLAAELFLDGERELYLAIDKLDGMGMLPGFLADTRPYSVAAVRAALERNRAAFQEAEFDSELARWVDYAIGPRLLVRGTAGLRGSEKREIPDAEGGIPTPKGVSGRLSALARETSSPYVSAHASATWFFGKAGDDGTRVGDTAIETGLPYASLQIGRISAWYGPGRRGALLFTNNAQSYPGIRIHNPVPIAVPGLFSFLGNVQYDLFVARLGGEDRPVLNPLLSGMRLAIRPGRFLELGASRSMQFGGDGREESFSTYLDILTGRRESSGNTPTGNSLASLDAKVYLPFRAQPAVLYFEWGGEDQSSAFIFTRHALLGGIFLPSLGPVRRADLRFEIATTVTRDPGIWYRHPDYPHVYRGRILGHPMGTDARDLYVQGHYFIIPSTYLEVTLTRTDRYFTGEKPKESTDRAAAGLVGWISEKVRLEGEVAWEKVRNTDGIGGSNASDASFRLALSYQFGRGSSLETH